MHARARDSGPFAFRPGSARTAGNGYTFLMKRSVLKYPFALLCLCLCLTLSACGNKGPLVKPEPAGAEAKAGG